MKSLYEIIAEALKPSQYRKYMMVKRDPRSEAWLSAFWERVKEFPGAEVSRNGFRVYFKFDMPSKELELGDQQNIYSGESNNIRKDIKTYFERTLKYDIVKLDYIHGKFTFIINTQRGKKERDMNIGKVLMKAAKKDKVAQELLDKFSSDPIRLTSNLDAKKLMIVLSNHAYDIAGMSTDRKWTSCMNILNGTYHQWVKEDIKWGTVVAYLIEEDDKNINNPLGRVLIKPYLDDNNAVVYFPEPTVYSPYVGLESMRDFLEDMCTRIAKRVSWLYKIARDINDPNMEVPASEEAPRDLTPEEKKTLKILTKKELKELEREADAKNDFLLYYDDYFEKNKNYIGNKPETERKAGHHNL